MSGKNLLKKALRELLKKYKMYITKDDGQCMIYM